MNMCSGKNQLFRRLLIHFFVIAILVGCKDDKKSEDNVAGRIITESERLVIPATVDLPANLPAGNRRVATFYAEGVQKYRSRQVAGTNPATFEWVFVAPNAVLYDANNSRVGTHTVGPSWQLNGVADSIFAQAFDPPKFEPSANANSIDWLLLMPKTGKDATGIFSNVAYIQRIATVGGKAPATLPASDAETIDVKYTAIYRFSERKP